ncbi:hypothetical protein ACIBF5_28940 [Micromonospora sp. NPDC050417]|uniref:hypothetical protein n=1 Tax=Micromonospora sp. NPDC050417 TaxID=3364280 RepID=UPI00378FDA63
MAQVRASGVRVTVGGYRGHAQGGQLAQRGDPGGATAAGRPALSAVARPIG